MAVFYLETISEKGSYLGQSSNAFMTHSYKGKELSLSFFVPHQGLINYFPIQAENNWNFAMFEFAILDRTNDRITLEGHFTYKRIKIKHSEGNIFIDDSLWSDTNRRVWLL